MNIPKNVILKWKSLDEHYAVYNAHLNFQIPYTVYIIHRIKHSTVYYTPYNIHWSTLYA